MNKQTGEQGYPVFINAGQFAGEVYIDMHAHTGTELVLCTEGSCSIDLGSKISLDLPNGILCILPSVITHNQRNHIFTRTNWVIFTPNNPIFNETPRVLSPHTSHDKWVIRWIDDLCELYEKLTDDCSAIANGILSALIERIKQLEITNEVRGGVHPAVVKSLKIMESDITAPHTVASLAYGSMVSPSYLNALFIQSYNCGPMQYLQRLRIRMAKRLLSDPYLTIGEVGRMCGYDNPNYFTRIFQKRTGYNPMTFRKKG